MFYTSSSRIEYRILMYIGTTTTANGAIAIFYYDYCRNTTATAIMTNTTLLSAAMLSPCLSQIV